MTHLFLDDQEIEMPSPAAGSFRQLLEYVDNACLPPHTAIKHINVDGRPLLADDLLGDQSGLYDQIDRAEKIEIFTATAQEIALEAIQEAVAYLRRVEGAVPPLAWDLRSNPGPGALESLRHLFEGFYWLNLLLNRLNNSFKDHLEGLNVAGLTPHEHYLHQASVLKLLVESQEHRDMAGTANLLEYEISPAIPVWKELFTAAGASLRSASGGGVEGQRTDNRCVNPLTLK
jgi:hypothetical protein